MLTLVSNRDSAIMIVGMGFAQGRSIAWLDVQDVRPIKRLMCSAGFITLVSKRNRVVFAASEWTAMPPVAPPLQNTIQVAKELFKESEIDDARSDQLHRAHLFDSNCEFSCLHVWRWSACVVVSLKLANEFCKLQGERNWTMNVIVLSKPYMDSSYMNV